MTPAAERFLQLGRDLNEGVTCIERELGGQDLRPEGALSITTIDTLLYRFAPVFLDFQKQYPDIELRIISSNRSLDLMQRDADIALRPTAHPPEHWIGRSLLPVVYTSYATPDYAKLLSSLPPQKHRWARLDDSLSLSPMSQITALRIAAGAPVMITNSVMGLFHLVRAGFGIAVLPCYMGENSSELVRLEDPDPRFSTELWMLAHPDIRRSTKVHAFFEFATARIRESGFDFST